MLIGRISDAYMFLLRCGFLESISSSSRFFCESKSKPFPVLWVVPQPPC